MNYIHYYILIPIKKSWMYFAGATSIDDRALSVDGKHYKFYVRTNINENNR